MVQVVILCKHDTGEEGDHRKVVSDYHPLNKGEISELLEMAKSLNPVMEAKRLSQIKARLHQGIMEMICPPPDYDGPVSGRMFLVDKLFARRASEGATPDLVDAFDDLLNWHE